MDTPGNQSQLLIFLILISWLNSRFTLSQFCRLLSAFGFSRISERYSRVQFSNVPVRSGVGVLPFSVPTALWTVPAILVNKNGTAVCVRSTVGVRVTVAVTVEVAVT